MRTCRLLHELYSMIGPVQWVGIWKLVRENLKAIYKIGISLIFIIFIIFSYIQSNKMIDGTPAPSSLPVSTMNHWIGSTRIPYFKRFSKRSRIPLIVSKRNPQFTKPVKLWKPELHENNESLGRWHLWVDLNLYLHIMLQKQKISQNGNYGLSGCERRCLCCFVEISSARVTLRVRRLTLSDLTSSVSIFTMNELQQ